MKKSKPIFYYGGPEVCTIIDRPDIDWRSMKMTRVWAMPSHETFKIKPIANLLRRYVVDGKNWIDPFAGNNSPAQFKNDLNHACGKNQDHFTHMPAIKYAQLWKSRKFDGILFDPPYSFRQISEHYKIAGIKPTRRDTSMAFYEKVKSAFCERIKPGGYAISFGWNSNGFGRARGFEIVETLLIAHGGSKNDTIVVVEKKIKR